MDFKNAKELLELCQNQNLPISEIMLRREMTEGEMPEEEASRRMARALAIMKESVHTPIQTPVRSMGGLIGAKPESWLPTRQLVAVSAAMYWKRPSPTR